MKYQATQYNLQHYLVIDISVFINDSQYLKMYRISVEHWLSIGNRKNGEGKLKGTTRLKNKKKDCQY